MAINLNNAMQANTLARKIVRAAALYKTIMDELTALNASIVAEDVVNQFTAFQGSTIGSAEVSKDVLGAGGLAAISVLSALDGMSANDKAALTALLNNFGAQSLL